MKIQTRSARGRLVANCAPRPSGAKLPRSCPLICAVRSAAQYGSQASRRLVNDTEVGTQAQPLANSDVIEVAGVKVSFHLN